MNIKAIFTQTVDSVKTDIKRNLDEENSCYVPSVLEEGKCTFTLYGIGGAGGSTKATTNSVDFILIKQNYDPDEGSGGDDGDDYDEDYVATRQLRALEELFEDYHDKHGNGYVTTLMRKVRALPVIGRLDEDDNDIEDVE